MNLIDLVGKHVLTGVDFAVRPATHETYFDDEDSNTMAFVLDGKGYLAVEDPEDGYRSCLKELIETSEPIKNTFAPCEVLGTLREEYNTTGESGTAEVLEFRDTTTGKIVLEVGTDNTDDYYPWYVAKFSPENMKVNQPFPEYRP